jgi:predicted RNase H-like HicB family nuclease
LRCGREDTARRDDSRSLGGKPDVACYPAGFMGTLLYHVHADWDPEAGVWVATSDDVPGLATEAATLEALTEKLRSLVPELLEANQLLGSDQPEAISFELTSLREEQVRLAS